MTQSEEQSLLYLAEMFSSLEISVIQNIIEKCTPLFETHCLMIVFDLILPCFLAPGVSLEKLVDECIKASSNSDTEVDYHFYCSPIVCDN